MLKQKLLLIVAVFIIFVAATNTKNLQKTEAQRNKAETEELEESENVTAGSEEYRGFILDNVLHSQSEGDIHYNVYIPDSYDGTKKYALYVTLPGYQGLYFQGGGEKLSLILAKQPELFTAALMCSSRWDGAYEPIVEAKTPVYFVIGESDEYYGSEPFKEAYQQIYDLYKRQGLSEADIDKLLVLDIKGKDYFAGTPVTYQHGGGYLFCRDKEIMEWLFSH